MAIIRKVKLNNWKSHHQSEFEFSPGVNVLVGDMGSGKSSVLEAICFALYGTSPDLKSNVVNLDNMIMRSPSKAKSACVELELEIKGKKYSIKREIKRDKGTGNCEVRENGSLLESPQSTKVTDVVNSLLSLDFDLFSRALYAEQDNLDYFLNLRSGKRKEEIDSLLKLDKFENARKTSVKVKNRLEGKIEDRKKDLQSYDQDKIKEKRSNLSEGVEEKEEELEELEDKIKDLETKAEDKKQQLEELKEKQEKYQQLEKQTTQLKSKIETLREQKQKMEDKVSLDPEDYQLEDVETKLKKKNRELKEAKERKQEIKEREKKLVRLNSELDTLKEDIKLLKEKKSKKESLEATKEELSQTRNEVNQLQSQLKGIEMQLEEKQEALDALAGSDDKCPVCKSELSEEKREDLVKEREQEINKLKEKKSEVKKKLEQEQESISDLKEKKDSLSKYEGLEERLGDKKDKKGEIEGKLDKLEEVDSEEIEDEIEEIKQEKDNYEQLQEIKELERTIEVKKKDLKSLSQRKTELEFDEDNIEQIAEQYQQLDKKREVARSEKKSKAAVIEEKKERLEEIKDNLNRISQLKKELSQFRSSQKKARKLASSLTKTQKQLREKFVSDVNGAMNTIWQRVYPYQGYSSIRLHGKEDYSLELEGDNGWVPVEGEVSGGERQSAALTLRIALALVLAPNFRVLILDEPTHNLDVNAIEELSATLRRKVSDLVEQLFIITHEERLEEAVTANFYRLRKENGISQISDSR